MTPDRPGDRLDTADDAFLVLRRLAAALVLLAFVLNRVAFTAEFLPEWADPVLRGL